MDSCNVVNCKPIVRPLKPELQKKAIEELNEVPERLQSDLMALRAWIRKQPHLRARMNDQFLVSFLRGTKYSLEKAKQKIDRYYTLKTSIPEIYNGKRNVDNPMVLEIIRLGIILQIPLSADDTGPTKTIIRVGSYDTKKYKFADVVRVGSMFFEIMSLEDDNATISGYVEIMDMANISSIHLFQLQPDLLRRLSLYADEAMPTRQRGIHFINVPAAFESAFNSLKKFFPAKMLSKITVSSDPDAIFNDAPKSALPKEYGGDNGTIKDITNSMEAKMLRYRDHFDEEKNFGCDEKLRENGQSVCYEKYFGAEGSFRKLDID